MSHYAVVKRIECTYVPVWYDQVKRYQHSDMTILQYEYEVVGHNSMYYYNAIVDTVINEELTIYWEGEIHQDILNKGEYLVINEESFEILKVEKDVNGNVIYHINGKLSKADYYGSELNRAKGHYEDYSKQLQNIEKNKEDLFKKKSWFERIFG